MKEIIEYYSDGRVSDKYYLNKTGKIEGLYFHYYTKGEMSYSFNYKNGILNGKYESYYNDSLRQFCFYKDDITFGQNSLIL